MVNESVSEKEMPTDLIIESATSVPEGKKKDFLNEVVEVEKSVWPSELRATREKFESRATLFPQGFIVAELDGKIKGLTTSEITTYDLSTDKTWNEITDNGTLKATHNSLKDSLYVVSVGVSPDSQGMGIGGRLVRSQIDLAKQLGLKRVFLGARVPGYNQYCKKNGEISVEDYLKLKNEEGEAIDPEIRFYQRQGLNPVKIVANFESDASSRNYGVVMVWENNLVK